jgi:hypothetical protein
LKTMATRWNNQQTDCPRFRQEWSSASEVLSSAGNFCRRLDQTITIVLASEAKQQGLIIWRRKE